MKTLKILSTMVLSATLLCACVSADKNAIFTVNSKPVTKNEFQKEFERYLLL